MRYTFYLMNHFVNLGFELGLLTVQELDITSTKQAWDVAGDALVMRFVTSRVPHAVWWLIFVFFTWVKCSWLLTKLVGEIITDLVTDR